MKTHVKEIPAENYDKSSTGQVVYDPPSAILTVRFTRKDSHVNIFHALAELLDSYLKKYNTLKPEVFDVSLDDNSIEICVERNASKEELSVLKEEWIAEQKKEIEMEKQEAKRLAKKHGLIK